MAYPLSWSWRAYLLARGTQSGLYLFATETLLLLGNRSDDHRSAAPRVRDAGGSQLRGYSRPERDRICFLFLAGLPVVARLKNLHAQKLYRPETGRPDAYPNLQPVLTRPIKRDLIRQHYDEMIKFATALRLGTAETEEILRRFTRNGVQHPTYTALLELGKVQRTIFLCLYLQSEALRREIQEGLNVVENWNSATNFIHFGRHGEFSTNNLEEDRKSTRLN